MRLLLLPFAPTFSLKAFDPSDPGGRIVVEMYPHRTPDAPPIVHTHGQPKTGIGMHFFITNWRLW